MPERTRTIRRYRCAETTASARAAIWVRRVSTSSSSSSSEVAKAPSTSTVIRWSCSRSSASDSPAWSGRPPTEPDAPPASASDSGACPVSGSEPDPALAATADPGAGRVSVSDSAPGTSQLTAYRQRRPPRALHSVSVIKADGRSNSAGIWERSPRVISHRWAWRGCRGWGATATRAWSLPSSSVAAAEVVSKCSSTPPTSSMTARVEPRARSRSANWRPSGVKRSTSPTWSPMAPSPVTRAAALSSATVRVSELQRVGSASSAKGRRSPASASIWATPASPRWAWTTPIRTRTADPETSWPTPTSCVTSATSMDIAGHSPLGTGTAPRTSASSLSSTGPEGFLTAQLPSWMQDCSGLQPERAGVAGRTTPRRPAWGGGSGRPPTSVSRLAP